jgi:endonuclease III
MVSQKTAINQLNALKKLGKEQRLAADGWPHKWQTVIATLMSARTTDKRTIPVAEELFRKYPSIQKLSRASISNIGLIIRPVNFYKTKSKNIKKLAQIVVKKYQGDIPLDFDKLVELPGVGRKTANVVLAEYEGDNIGVDTHVNWLSKQLGWTRSDKQEVVENDLKKLFPKSYWRNINWILVRFGQTFPSRKKKLEILKAVKKIKA